MFGLLFNTYLKAFSRFGMFLGSFSHSKHDSEQALSTRKEYFVVSPPIGDLNLTKTPWHEEFESADAAAMKFGNEFRGSGVFIGVLGIVIVFLAVAPTGFAVEDEFALVVYGLLKVALMAILFAMVLKSGKSNRKERWLEMREQAEELRYRTLRIEIDRLKKNPNQCPEDMNALRLHLLHLIGDPVTGQLAYNARCAERYEAVERAATVLTWLAFGVSFLSAIFLLGSDFHWVAHQPALIFGTAAVPAAVGGLHGINGFLQIGPLIDEHKKIERNLSDQFELIRKSSESESLLEAAVAVHGILSKRDEWKERIEKTRALPG